MNLRVFDFSITLLSPAAGVSAPALLGVSYLDCHHPRTAVTLLVVAVGIQGLSVPVFLANFFDIAQRYAVTVQTVATGHISTYLPPMDHQDLNNSRPSTSQKGSIHATPHRGAPLFLAE